MSTPANTNVEPTVSDLLARRQALGIKQQEMEARGAPYNPALSEEQNAKAQSLFQEELRQVVRDQLEIMACLRKTAAGPAKAGGKRAKKAPIDLAALEDSVFG